MYEFRCYRPLVLVEGARTDARLIQHLIQIYSIDSKYQIVSYNTNIYTLYNAMFSEGDPASMDILQILKEREKNPQQKKLFEDKYSDILLIFDFDPQDPLYSEKKIIEMMKYFVESSEMGKLYINYPMIESFYHMKSIPDGDYLNRYALFSELKAGTYKQRVNSESRDHNYTKFACTRDECNTVILENMEKAWYIIEKRRSQKYDLPDSLEVLTAQIRKLNDMSLVYVLCTCVFFIVDYNPKLVTR